MTSTNHRARSSTSKSKTIKPPGSNTTRVSVACDRCRKKKIRCFYDDDDKDYKPGETRPCGNCKAVGLECIFTDKLARKAFPRGYTESLEERVRELEFENKKMQKLLTLKNETSAESPSAPTSQSPDGIVHSSSEEHSSATTPSTHKLPLNDENLTMFNNQQQKGRVQNTIADHEVLSCGHLHDEACSCGYAHSIHNRPVSIAGSVDIDRGELSDDDISLYSATPSDQYPLTTSVDDLRDRYGYNSFEQANAPGAAAAISLQNKLRTKNFMNLANLIAASIPRSTEETLFIPTLLARIVSVHGFNSKAPYLTARSIALLKEKPNEGGRYSQFSFTFKGINFNAMKREESIQFFQDLNLPNYMNLDLCITVFFDTWNKVIPILSKEIFMSNYMRFSKSREQNFQDGEMIGLEKFGELLVIITALVMLSHERHNSSQSKHQKNASNSEILQFYDHMIKQFIESNLSSICSIPSLQMVSIELFYCLTTGDLNTSYELRGKMVTMSQQLRLQRCPAAVLGYNGSSVSKLQQGERRILFWCSYTLDAFSAFILGVPRLFKDYEIECALPSSSSSNKEKDSDTNMITFNNSQLSLVGKVGDSALSVMRYARILGTIVDTVFKRSSNNLKKPSADESSCLVLEEMLDSWRREMPPTISFDRLDVDGKLSDYEKLNDTQLTLLYLYYQAKALIYMPLMASESKSTSKNSPAFISIQQATTAILTITKVLSSQKHNYYYLPIPMNVPRQKARFALLAAKGALEYTRGGALFQESKNLLNAVTDDLKNESDINMLGCLSMNCCTCLEHAIDAILSQPKPSVSPSPPPSTAHIIQDRIDPHKNDTRRKGSSPLKNVAIMPDEGNAAVKQEQDSTSALNDIFSNKAGYQIQTLQQQMRQPIQSQQQRSRSVSSGSGFAQGYTGAGATQALQAPITWNPDNMGSYRKEQEQQLNESLQNLQDSNGENVINMIHMNHYQEDKNMNATVQQIPPNMETQHQLQQPTVQQIHKQMVSEPIKSFSDLLMLNDFGVDASLGLPLMDFELDGPNKKPKIDGNSSPSNTVIQPRENGTSTGDYNSYNSLFNWH
ncbi:hypothetical protein FOA43_000103 [Brettanomyces nanus]|uniref:Zn(2)-C6 fungal-type domain-containing protein n=1 Tax=Eeniella nana TaxID=13502 RepID=A0A875RVD1_EENNA|nr:uncharacterized protein FOA43_000103 [Brettanomyces nanus]QPG72801.1 hypothetical protein FOA43_000103 [Brettanomyces nanus]